MHIAITACLGIDVSGRTLTCTLRILQRGRSGIRRDHHKSFSHDIHGIEDLRAWACQSAGCEPMALRVAMEATGGLHDELARSLHSAGCEVIVCNPKRLKDYSHGIGRLHKTDRADALVLVEFAQHFTGRLWQPIPAEIAELRALLDRQHALRLMCRSDSAREKAAVRRRIPAPVQASLERVHRFLTDELAQIDKAITHHFRSHPGLLAAKQLIVTIPCVRERVANELVCLLRSRNFRNAREAAALAGLVPIRCDSGSSLRGSRLRQGAGWARLRGFLYLSTMSLIRSDRATRVMFDEWKAKGKRGKQIMFAIMRKRIHTAFGVLRHGRGYVRPVAPSPRCASA